MITHGDRITAHALYVPPNYEREVTPGKMQALTTVSSVLNSAKFIAAHAQHVKISQSGVTKAAREVGQTRTMKEVELYHFYSLYSIPSFLILQLFCAMGSEGVGNGSVVVDPLEPPGLSEKEILEW